MGYDLYVERKPDDLVEVENEISAYVDRHGWDYEDETLIELYGRHDEIARRDSLYWRQSIWSMSRFRRVIDELGMLSDEQPGDVDEEQEGPIPVGRLSDNSGWLISEAQCRELCRRMDEHLEDPVLLPRLIGAYSEDGASAEWEAQARRDLIHFRNMLDSPDDAVFGDQVQDDLEAIVRRLWSMRDFFKSASEGGGFRVF